MISTYSLSVDIPQVKWFAFGVHIFWGKSLFFSDTGNFLEAIRINLESGIFCILQK